MVGMGSLLMHVGHNENHMSNLLQVEPEDHTSHASICSHTLEHRSSNPSEECAPRARTEGGFRVVCCI